MLMYGRSINPVKITGYRNIFLITIVNVSMTNTLAVYFHKFSSRYGIIGKGMEDILYVCLL